MVLDQGVGRESLRWPTGSQVEDQIWICRRPRQSVPFSGPLGGAVGVDDVKPVADLKFQASAMVDQFVRTGRPMVVTRGGRRPSPLPRGGKPRPVSAAPPPERRVACAERRREWPLPVP